MKWINSVWHCMDVYISLTLPAFESSHHIDHDSVAVKIGFQKCLKAGGSTPKYWNSFGIIIITAVAIAVVIITLKWKLSLDGYFSTEGRIISFIDVRSVWIDWT